MSQLPADLTWATVTIDDGLAEVVLVANGKASRQGPAFWAEMPKLFDWLDRADHVRCVLVHGAGEGFSHGIDLVAMTGAFSGAMAGGAKARTTLYDLVRDMQRAGTSVARCRKPVVAAVHGWCIGAGVDLISACDVRVCSAEARFSVREVKLAIVADMGSLARLPAIIGQGATRELAFTGDDIDAQRALRLGLVSDVHADHDALLVSARAMCRRIAGNPPLVVQGVKQVLNTTSEPASEQSLQAVAMWNAAFLPSSDLMEAMTAFAAKRPPKFKGD